MFLPAGCPAFDATSFRSKCIWMFAGIPRLPLLYKKVMSESRDCLSVATRSNIFYITFFILKQVLRLFDIALVSLVICLAKQE